MHFVGSSSKVYCDKLQNRLSADFSSRVLFCKEAYLQNHKYVFIFPSKTWQHHSETKAANVYDLVQTNQTLSINCLPLLTFHGERSSTSTGQAFSLTLAKKIFQTYHASFYTVCNKSGWLSIIRTHCLPALPALNTGMRQNA